MRANQSSTALVMDSCSGPLTQPPPIHAAASDDSGGRVQRPGYIQTPFLPSSSSTGIHGGSLRHDARNLMGALRLYCDLLSMPGVLKPEHSHYAEELRLLNTRSEALIEHLIQLLSHERTDGLAVDASSKDADAESSFGARARIAVAHVIGKLASPSKPVSRWRPAAASTKMGKSGNGLGEAFVTDRCLGTLPAQQDAMSNTTKSKGTLRKLPASGLPSTAESSADDSKSITKHPEDSQAVAGGIESC